jgi:hypothetical protein
MRACVLRRSSWACCLGFVLTAGSVHAQTQSRSPREIGQIIDAALQAVIPPEQRLSRQTVAERGIRFDYHRTLADFGLADNSEVRANLGLTRAMTGGSDTLLAGCDQEGMEACERIGQSAYVFVKPISVSDSAAAVWVNVLWATHFPKRAFLSGFSTEVFLTRSGSGPWKFLRTGTSIVS